MDRSIPLATLSVGQEVRVCARACVCVISHSSATSLVRLCICVCVSEEVHLQFKMSCIKKTAANHWMYYLNVCICVENKRQKQKRKLYMMMCFTGSKYSDIEELRKKWTQYFNITLLSSEMYFDVHYDYTTSLRHPWYMSSFVFFRNKKKEI